MHYEDFELQIRRASEGGFAVHVRSPAGETEGRLGHCSELEALLPTPGEVDRQRPVPERHLVSGGEAETEARATKALDRALFGALFGDEVGVLFYDSLARVGPGTGGAQNAIRASLVPAGYVSSPRIRSTKPLAAASSSRAPASSTTNSRA